MQIYGVFFTPEGWGLQMALIQSLNMLSSLKLRGLSQGLI
jgi:hypothetical protein